MKAKKFSFGALVAALFLLINPTVILIDPLPDFIAWFLLARVFTPAADRSFGFSEARKAFLKLGWLNLAKIAGIGIVILVRGQNTSDNDVIPLVTTVFCAIEILLLLPAIRAAFGALFHLGERSDATALIGKGAEVLPTVATVFLVFKCLADTLPHYLLLTKTGGGASFSITNAGAYSTLLFVLLGLTLAAGIFFFVQTVGYAKRVRAEGKFCDALEALGAEGGDERIAAAQRKREIERGLILLVFSMLFRFDLAFENYGGVNILPTFISGLFVFLSISAFLPHTKLTKKGAALAKGAALLYTLLSAAYWGAEFAFLSKYEYALLSSDADAIGFYGVVKVLGILEFLSLLVTCLFLGRVLLSLLSANDRTRAERKAHCMHTVRFLIFFGIDGAVRLFKVFLSASVSLLTIKEGDGTTREILTTPLPWFGLVVFAAALAAVFAAWLYRGYVKEELIDEG